MLKKILLLAFLLLSFSFSDEKDYEMKFDKKTTCEIRKIKVYKNPIWVSKIDFSNGKNVYFCSTKSMFEFYFNPKKWKTFKQNKIEDLKNIIVTDFKTFKPINAKKAYFVYGSNQISPAGDDLVSFKSLNDAKIFMKKYNGKRVLKFNEIKNSLINLLNGRV